ncbi:MAG TPA: hypothetical protein VJR02_11015 [Pyrinomonadaceae bacterium]|nr:hypothetical protein [Pyrinomonadaceae bacterium]
MTHEEQEKQYTREAERALASFMETQRQRRVASDIFETAFRDGEIGSRTVSDNEADADYEDTKQAALEYAQARNIGARVRSYAQDNESQRAGVRSALAWLDRKKKSAIKKR